MCVDRLRIVVNPEYERYGTFISTLPETFDSDGQTIYSKRNVVKRFQLTENTVFIVKRYKVPNMIQRLAYSSYRQSKAARAYHYASQFLQRGIDTPKPVAFIEIYRKGLFTDSYFISTEDSRTSCEALLDSSFAELEELTDSLACFIISLHDKGILHGDLNLSNILYNKDANGNYAFAVIDTNRSRFVKKPSAHCCLKNMMRMTHDLSVSAKVVTAYANRRGWDATECVDYVRKEIKAFEHRNDLKHSFRKKNRTKGK